mgnify:CR=1 FL=1
MGAHPFSTGTDQCLVHNGSLSNHNSLRRRLRRNGVRIETENDTEVAAAYLSHRMQQGRNLGEALEDSLEDLDGFFTFVVGTKNGFGVLRDPIACKPAVMAYSQDVSYPCHTSLHLKHTSVRQLGHVNLLANLSSALKCWPHSGFGHQRTNGSESKLCCAVKRLYLSHSSCWPFHVRIFYTYSSEMTYAHSWSKHLSFFRFALSIRPLKDSSVQSTQKRCLHSNSTQGLSLLGCSPSAGISFV